MEDKKKEERKKLAEQFPEEQDYSSIKKWMRRVIRASGFDFSEIEEQLDVMEQDEKDWYITFSKIDFSLTVCIEKDLKGSGTVRAKSTAGNLERTKDPEKIVDYMYQMYRKWHYL